MCTVMRPHTNYCLLSLQMLPVAVATFLTSNWFAYSSYLSQWPTSSYCYWSLSASVAWVSQFAAIATNLLQLIQYSTSPNFNAPQNHEFALSFLNNPHSSDACFFFAFQLFYLYLLYWFYHYLNQLIFITFSWLLFAFTYPFPILWNLREI